MTDLPPGYPPAPPTEPQPAAPPAPVPVGGAPPPPVAPTVQQAQPVAAQPPVTPAPPVHPQAVGQPPAPVAPAPTAPPFIPAVPPPVTPGAGQPVAPQPVGQPPTAPAPQPAAGIPAPTSQPEPQPVQPQPPVNDFTAVEGDPNATFRKDQVESIIGERLAKQARSFDQRTQALLAGRTPEQAAQIIQAHDQAIEAGKDEITRAREAEAAATARAAELEASNRYASMRSELILALNQPVLDQTGQPLPVVNTQYLESVLALAMPVAMASVDPANAVNEAVAYVRQQAAPMFGQAPPPAVGTPGGAPLPPPGPVPVPGRPIAHQRQNGAVSAEEAAVAAFKARKSGNRPPSVAPPPAPPAPPAT